jgi:hypothetical protein
MSGAFWQVGIVVDDIERAQDELTRALGVTWTRTLDLRLGDWEYRLCLSNEGPPYLELLEGPPGSPWDGADGSRIDHLGYWTEDIAGERHRLEDAGVPVAYDGETAGLRFNYHDLPLSGIRIEPIDVWHRDRLRRTFGLEDLG